MFSSKAAKSSGVFEDFLLLSVFLRKAGFVFH